MIIIGIVLCGGQSTRMGSDKGLLKNGLNTWVQQTADKLKSLSIPALVSINLNQIFDYSKIFSSKELILDNESLKIKGPLCRVLSAHIQYPNHNLIVLACDMPLIETKLLKNLLDQYEKHHEAEAIVFTNNGEPEPLCGIYNSKALAHIYDLYKKDQLFSYSMKNMLENISTFFIPPTADKKKYFANINSHAELDGL